MLFSQALSFSPPPWGSHKARWISLILGHNTWWIAWMVNNLTLRDQFRILISCTVWLLPTLFTIHPKGVCVTPKNKISSAPWSVLWQSRSCNENLVYCLTDAFYLRTCCFPPAVLKSEKGTTHSACHDLHHDLAKLLKVMLRSRK